MQLIVPQILRESVLAELHEGSTGGHLGPEMILGELKERFYWPGHCTEQVQYMENITPKQRGSLQLL